MSDTAEQSAIYARAIMKRDAEIERLREALRVAQVANETLYRETKRMAELEARLAEAERFKEGLAWEQRRHSETLLRLAQATGEDR